MRAKIWNNQCAVTYYWAYGSTRVYIPFLLGKVRKIYRNFQWELYEILFYCNSQFIFLLLQIPKQFIICSSLPSFLQYHPRYCVYAVQNITWGWCLLPQKALSFWESALARKMSHYLCSIMTVESIICWSLSILMSKQNTLTADKNTKNFMPYQVSENIGPNSKSF